MNGLSTLTPAPLPDPRVETIARELNLSPQVVRDIAERLDGPSRFRAGPLDTTHPRARELQRHICAQGERLYKHAAEKRMSFSRLLRDWDYPESEYGDKLDPFERQLKLCGIIPRNIPDEGVWSNPAIDFLRISDRVPTISQVLGDGYSGERYYMSDQPASIVLFPEFINRQMRVQGQILPPILQDLVALTQGIDSAVYDTFYLNLDVTQLSLRQIGELGDMPTAELTGSQHQVRLYKYGRVLKASYEVLRRMSIDRFSFHLQQMAIQAAVDKSQTALDVIINGDGNTGTPATNYNKTAVQGGVNTDALNVTGWLTFNLKFRDPYKITTIIGTTANLISLLNLNMGTFNIPFMQFQNLQAGLGAGFNIAEPWNMNQPIKLYARDFAPTNAIVAIDNSRAIEMLIEIGADIVETEKIIRNQSAEIAISEVVGFANLDPLANKTLTLNA